MDKANVNFDKANANRDRYGNITANNKNGLTATGNKRRSDNRSWRFGDSCGNLTPTKIG